MKKKFLLIGAAAAILVAGIVLLSPSDGGEEAIAENAVKSRRIADRGTSARRESRIKERRNAIKGQKVAEKVKPVITLTEDESAELDELQKKVLAELTKALDNNDFALLQAAIRKFRDMGLAAAGRKGSRDWLSHLPRTVRTAMVEALGWFEGAAIPELAEFVADPDPDIAQMAIDKFEMAIQDYTLGDYARNEIIRQVSTVITDTELVDWMYMEVLNSRHSSGIETILYMLQNGTAPVKASAMEYMEFFTGEEIKTVEEAERWLQENPDDPEIDDDLYGPIDAE